MPKPLPVGVLEARKENEDPLKGMQQAKGYADCQRFEVKYVFATNGHKYGEYDFFSQLQGGPFPFPDFPAYPDLTARYAKDLGIDIIRPDAEILFQADSPAWSQCRYYQDAAIRAAFEKIIRCQVADIKAEVVDLKAVNPNAVAKVDDRTPQRIIQNIEVQGRIVAQALARLSALL